MKKMLVILAAAIGFLGVSNTAFAQQRIKLADGIYLVSYGSSFGIENDNTQQSISLSVTQKRSAAGELVYDVMCGNQLVKEAAKYGLSKAIQTVLTAYGAPSWLGAIAGSATRYIYDAVCDHYKI
jgi:hypothetical protein